MDKNTISSSLEDYLEAISEIIEQNGHAHTKDIADKIGVKMPSATNALQSLSARALIDYQPHNPVKLTPKGAELAAVIRRRHRSLKLFFSELLHLDIGEADRAACEIEHVIGENITSRLALLAEAVSEREDCADLRKFLAARMPELSIEGAGEQLPLAELAESESGVIVAVGKQVQKIRKFADLGLVTGTVLTMEGHAPFGDLIRVRVMGSSLTLRGMDARHILVKRIGGDDHE